jgi:aldehyde dehydrogenase
MTSDQRATLDRAPDDAPIPVRMIIGGDHVEAADGQTFEVVNPATGKVIATAPLGGPADVDRAVEAARRAFDDRKGWASWAAGKRGRTLAKLAALIKEHTEELAQLESRNVGKPITGARGEITGVSLVFDYYAGAANKLFGQTVPVSKPGLDLTLREPIGVVGLIVPWNFPLLMASWKVAPALAAGNTAILKPASYSPLTAIRLGELALEAGIPPGVLNIVTGPGGTAGASIAAHPGIGKVAFTGETTTGRLIMQYASDNIIPVTLELGGKSPNIFFEDVVAKDDDFFDKALEGLAMFAFNQGEVCTCPSRALVHEKIYDRFMERAIARVKAMKQGNPLDPLTMVGAQASNDQLEKILSYLDIGRQEGAKVLIGGARADMGPELAGGFYVQPTILEGHNKMRIFQEEIFGPVLSVTKFKDDEEALSIANDSLYGLGAGVWTRDGTRAYRFGRAIQAGRVWTNCFHLYPAHAAFGGYKQSGIGRENHKMMLDHYQQTKNLLVSYSPKALGFF